MKNLRTIILLFCANTISSIAQGISMIAIPWYFVQIGKSQLFTTIFFAVTATSLIWGPAAGTLVDKYNRKHIFLFLTTLVGLVIGSVAIYSFQIQAMPWELAAIVFMATFLNYNLHYPNLYAFLQEVTEPKHYGKITSYVEIQGQISTMMAGAAAAMLLEGVPDGKLNLFGTTFQLPFTVPKLELAEIFAIDASTYFVAFCLIILMKYTPIAQRKAETGNLVNRFKLGLSYLKQHPRILIFGIASYMVFATMLVGMFTVFPIYVKNHLQAPATVYAVGDLFYSGGAILSGIFIIRLFSKGNKVNAIIAMTLIGAVGYVLLIPLNYVVVFFFVLLLVGITNAGIRIIRTTYLFEIVPNQVYGRIGSIFFVTNILFRLLFLSIFSISFFHEGNQARYFFWVFVCFLLAAVAVLWWNEKRSIKPK